MEREDRRELQAVRLQALFLFYLEDRLVRRAPGGAP